MPDAELTWREPTRSLPLRWGHYEDRYVLGLLLIIGGATSVQGSNTYALGFLVAGTIATAVGWSILPAGGWRRALVVLPVTAQTWVFVAGPQSVFTLLIPYLAWLLVRHRPGASYLTAVFPLATSFVIPPLISEYSGMPLAIIISMAVIVASAWLARLLAARSASAKPVRSPSKSG